MLKKITLCILLVLSFLIFNLKAEALNGANLEVDINLNLPIKNVDHENFKLTISDSLLNQGVITLDKAGLELMENVTIGNQTVNVKIRKLNYDGLVIVDDMPNTDVYYFAVTFYDLLPGKYQINLQATGYKTLNINDIDLTNSSKRVSFSNNRGMFELGDVNNDNQINQADVDELIKHFNNLDANILKKYDLNKDGQINIIDLSYIASILNNDAKQALISDTKLILNPSDITISGASLEGTLDNLLNNNDTLDIKTLDNSTINLDNPVSFDIDFKSAVLMEEIRLTPDLLDSKTTPTNMQVIIIDENNEEHIIAYQENSRNEDLFTDEDNNSLKIRLNGQIAVKKITIVIRETKEASLKASISKVEFLNNVYEKVPAPKMDIPLNLKAVVGSEEAVLSFEHAANVTGYELKVYPENNPSKTTIIQTTYNTYKIEDLKNYTTYKASVQSVNGTWKSGYSKEISFMPLPNRLPPVVEGIKITGVYAGLDISWKKMDDTLRYKLNYRLQGDENFTSIDNINATSYSLRDLLPGKFYEITLQGINDLGISNASLIHLGQTLDLTAPITTNYKLINTSNGVGVKSNHIKNVEYPRPSDVDMGQFSIVDNDFSTYWNVSGWDAGGYNTGSPTSPIIEFDNAYEMDRIIFASGSDEPSFYNYFHLVYWDNDNVKHVVKQKSLRSYQSSNGQKYYLITMQEPIVAKKIQANLGLYWPGAPNARIRIREMKFYHYDSLEKDVASLFTDDLRIELAENVTLEKIEALTVRANTIDPINNEYHYNKDVILADIALAKSILLDEKINDIITVNQNYNNARNAHLGLAMSLSDYQPLGVSVRALDKIAVYVGTKGNVLPQLVITQHYAESGLWQKTINLEKGQNIITVDMLGDMQTERGGSLYIRYPNFNKTDDEIKVRVSGGIKIPILDVTDITDEVLMKQKIKEYVVSLENHVSTIGKYYENNIADPVNNIYLYDEKTSVYNLTEIVTNNGLFSFIATSVNRGLSQNGTTIDEKVNRLYNVVTGYEEMIDLFYRQKGLSKNASLAINEAPASRVNIRYMRMFDGAFMYAGGLHIGIESGSVAGFMQGRANTTNNSTISTTGFFGWGISHEIGHQIDQSRMVYGETTNNIYSLLAQTNDDKSLSRLEQSNIYSDIYKKVTSNTTGISSNVFVSLGMFWQLHLAYDNVLTYEDTNSIYARLASLYRTTNFNEEPFRTANKDNILIMLASKAASKDLTEFFVKWGFVPTEATLNYVKDFEKETRAIYYLNDEARRYRLNGGASMKIETMVNANLSHEVDEYGNDSKIVTLNFDVTEENKETILGYEIIRNGEAIGFSTTNTYSDILGAINNRTFIYEVRAYDKHLNVTNTIKLDEIKVSHDGSILKDRFSISSNMRSTTDINTALDPSGPLSTSLLDNVIDNNYDTSWLGEVKVNSSDKTRPYIIVEMNENMTVTGLKYKAVLNNNIIDENTIKKYEIYVSKDNKTWTLAKRSTFNLTNEKTIETIYFDKPNSTGGNQLWAYNDIGYIKIVATNQDKISVAELDILAQPGDNISAENMQIGILDNDYLNEDKTQTLIEKSRVVIKGEYRGNPAYNAILIRDIDGNILAGEEILFASIPDNATLDEIALGTWIFSMTQEEYNKVAGKQVKAYLYRVNDAITNEGERLVSDTLTFDLTLTEDLTTISIE